MPRLLLLRHAKSVPAEAGGSDIDRPLALRGRRAASLVGEHLAHHHLLPDRILCSSARRTRETLAGLLPHLSGEATMRMTSALYLPAPDYLQPIARLGENASVLMVIGHNPAMQTTAARLIGAGNQAVRADVAAAFPTAGMAIIDFDLPWSKIAPGTGRIVAFFRPRDLELVDGKDIPASGDDD